MKRSDYKPVLVIEEMSRWGAAGNSDCAQLTRVKGTRSIFSNTLAQLTATRTKGKPFMVIQGPSGSGGPVNSVSIAAETGGINLTPTDFAAVVASETPAQPAPPAPPLLAAPTYNLSNITLSGSNLTVAWNAVPGATHYRVFIRNAGKADRLFSTGDTPMGRGGGGEASHAIGNFFDVDSGLQTGLTYTFNETPYVNPEIFVFSYANGVRGEFPKTELYANNDGGYSRQTIELYPTITCHYTGTWDNNSTTTMATFTNLYNGLHVTDSIKNIVDRLATDTSPPTLNSEYLDSKTIIQ